MYAFDNVDNYGRPLGDVMNRHKNNNSIVFNFQIIIYFDVI